MLRRLALSDMDSAARIHRIAFDQALPALTGLHTPEEDRSFFRERVFAECELWGAFGAAGMTGTILPYSRRPIFHDIHGLGQELEGSTA